MTVLGINLGPHAIFIEASYIVTVVVVVAMILWIVFDYAAQRRILGDFDARGLRRRSRDSGEGSP
ncbi:MAG: heme exporter protein CcmD [Bradyrhizobium sp. 35-63-5]|nr:MAG: heme exporter protein CcmD [Bradyrhizobium sp. 35-63-5]